MNLYDYIVKAIKELDQKNEERKPIKEKDFVKTYDEGFFDGVDDTLHDLREYLREFKKVNGGKTNE